MTTIGPYELNSIVTGDARDLAGALPDESIDIIFTDPPYLKEFLPLYGWLAETAARVLKPGGFLLSYIGNYWKYDIYRMFGHPALNYFWDFFELHAGMGTMVWDRRVIARGKSILCFSKGKAQPRTNVLSVWTGGGNEKRYHQWQQSASTVRYYIDCFAGDGAIVFDPFVGGGTTAAVCKFLNLPYIAFEIDAKQAELARENVRNTQMPLFTLEHEQGVMPL